MSIEQSNLPYHIKSNNITSHQIMHCTVSYISYRRRHNHLSHRSLPRKLLVRTANGILWCYRWTLSASLFHFVLELRKPTSTGVWYLCLIFDTIYRCTRRCMSLLSNRAWARAPNQEISTHFYDIRYLVHRYASTAVLVYVLLHKNSDHARYRTAVQLL